MQRASAGGRHRLFFLLTRPKPSPRSSRALADLQDAPRGVASESPTGTQVGEDERSRGGSCPEGRIPCVFAKGHVEGAVKRPNPLKDARTLLRPDAADPPEAHAVPTRFGGVRRPRAPTPLSHFPDPPTLARAISESAEGDPRPPAALGQKDKGAERQSVL